MTSVLVVPSVSANAKKKVKAKSIKISKTLTMKKGTKKTLKVTLKPKNVTVKKVKWTSSNTKVATVSSKGKITAKKSGVVKITAKTTDGSKKKATCTVCVLNKTVKASVKKNLNELKDYILDYGIENRVGQKGIWGSYSDPNKDPETDDEIDNTVYNIRYIPKTKRFELYWFNEFFSGDLDEYKTQTIITMDYALTGYDYCTAKLIEVKYDFDEPVASYSAEIIIPSSSYNRDGNMPTINIKSNTYTNSNKSMKEYANKDFRIAMTDWNQLLLSYLEFEFSDIGFTDF